MGLLRFALALAVVASHVGGVFGITFIQPGLAVILFFILSGYYMTLILNTKYLGFVGSYKMFYTNRILRLWPTYLVCLMVAIVAHWGLVKSWSDELSVVSYGAIILTNFTAIGAEWQAVIGVSRDGEMFFNPAQLTPAAQDFILIRQNWTLGLELTFYLIAPLIVKRWGVALSLFLLCVFLFSGSKYLGLSDYWRYHFFPITLLFFLIGVTSYHFGQFAESSSRYSVYRLFGAYLGYPLTISIILFPELATEFIPEQHIGKILFVLFFLFLPTWFRDLGQNKVDRFVGETSYPLYLVHTSIYILMVAWNRESVSGSVVAVVSVAVSVLIVITLERGVKKYRELRLDNAVGRKIYRANRGKVE